MNEFYEAVSNLFEELRCDFGEREYTVQPEEWKEAEKNMVFTSIHEVMIHSEDSADPRKLKEVLAETVEETTPEEDFLTYYVYHYNAETGQFSYY